MSKLIDGVAEFYRENGLDTDRNVLVCVSGGADSMCLLHVMRSFLGEKVSACHFNHRLRGDESDGDESFVRRYCEENGIRLFVGSGDVRSYAAERKLGTEDAARRLRYGFFRSVSGGASIATAHTADDQLETILLRLARGTGLKGLGGIPPVRGDIIRPLLGFTRADIEEYLAENGVAYRTDSTNLTDDYARNLIRHRVVPVLREINPRCAEHSEEMAALLRLDEAYLESAAPKGRGALSFSELTSLPFSLSSRAVRSLVPGLDSQHVRKVLDMPPNSSLSVPGATLRLDWDTLSVSEEDSDFSPVILSKGENLIPETGQSLLFEDIIAGSVHKSFTTLVFKKQSICGNITVRPRKEGDFIKLSPDSGTKTLKKLFIERKIPRSRRSSVPVFADEKGVIAVLGVGVDMRVRASEGDEAVIISIKEKDS